MKQRLTRLAKLYGVLWVLTTASFWPFYQNSQMALFHIILIQYSAFPAVTFLLSILIGREPLPVRYLCLVPVCFSLAHMLCTLLTLSLSQYLLAGVASVPELPEFLAVVLLSGAGLLLGRLLGWLCRKLRAK